MKYSIEVWRNAQKKLQGYEEMDLYGNPFASSAEEVNQKQVLLEVLRVYNQLGSDKPVLGGFVVMPEDLGLTKLDSNRYFSPVSVEELEEEETSLEILAEEFGLTRAIGVTRIKDFLDRGTGYRVNPEEL